MKLKMIDAGYSSPELVEYTCYVEAGFAASEPSGFEDLDFDAREAE